MILDMFEKYVKTTPFLIKNSKRALETIRLCKSTIYSLANFI